LELGAGKHHATEQGEEGKLHGSYYGSLIAMSKC
jgi:hypothetical protein